MKRELQTPEQRAIFAERAAARREAKNARKREKRRAERSGALALAPAGMSKTHPTYRRRLPAVPDMVMKSELRAFLAQAVRNTAGASA